MNDKTNKNPFAPIANFFTRFNVVIFIVVVASGLMAAILIINNILQLPYKTTGNAINNTEATFDKSIIVQLNKLKASDQNTNQILPTGRINPFI